MRHPTQLGRLLLAILLATLVIAPTGCSNDDPITPHDELSWTPDDVAVQVGYLVYALVRVLPELSSKSLLPELSTLGAPFSGDFWSDSNPSHAWTDNDHFLIWSPDVYAGVAFFVTFDIVSNNDLANGAGALEVTPISIEFEIEDVEVVNTGYPEAGQLLVDTSGWLATVLFTPAGATVTIADRVWEINMDDGTVTGI